MDSLPARPAPALTRSRAAKLLATTISSVRRLEARGMLHPQRDGRGHHLFDPTEVAQLAAARGLPAAGAPADTSASAAGQSSSTDPAADTSSLVARQTALEARVAAAEGQLAQLLLHAMPEVARRLGSVEAVALALAQSR